MTTQFCFFMPELLCFNLSFSCFSGDSVGKNVSVSAGDPTDMGATPGVGSVPGSGRSPGGGDGNPLQYSCLGNHLGRGAWWAAVYGLTKSWTRLSTHTGIYIYTQVLHFKYRQLLFVKDKSKKKKPLSCKVK